MEHTGAYFHIQLGWGQDAAGRSTNRYDAYFSALWKSPADVVNHVAQGGSHGDFGQAGPQDGAAEADELGALGGV